MLTVHLIPANAGIQGAAPHVIPANAGIQGAAPHVIPANAGIQGAALDPGFRRGDEGHV